MTSEFRVTTPDDANAIAEFLQSVFSMSSDHPVVNRRNMHWKYWQQHPDWQGSRGYVMMRGNDIIAHGSVVPLPCRWGDRSLRIVHLIDWAARPDSTGAGISLMTRVGKMVDGVFAAGGSAMTEKILPALGFKESNKAAPYVRPLRPLQVLLHEPEKSWKSVARLGRRVMWTMKAPSAGSRGWTARRVLPAELERTTLPMPRPTGEASSVFERSGPMLSWYLECPFAPSELYAVSSGNTVLGYFVITVALKQARIADAWIDSERVEDWTSLYNVAVETCRQNRDVAEVAAVTTTTTGRQALEAAGFQRRGEIALRFSLRGGPPPDIRYQLFDGEAAYLHDGRYNFWS